jgi:hypothetical protein
MFSRPIQTALALTVSGLAIALSAGVALAGNEGANARPLVVPLNDFNDCARGFHFPRGMPHSTIGRALVEFGGVPFVVEDSINPRALSIGSVLFNCTWTPVSTGVIPVGTKGDRVWLLAAGDNDPPFPNMLFETTIHYADGTSTKADVQEAKTGLSGFIEFSSWGFNQRPDLAVWSTRATDGQAKGTAYVYLFFVQLDPQRTTLDVAISAPDFYIYHAFVYAATLVP